MGHFEHKYDYVTNEGRTFFFRTNRDGAAKYKVVKITLPPAGDAAEADDAALAALPFEVRRVRLWVDGCWIASLARPTLTSNHHPQQ